jgi:hypothetical protein
MANVYDFLDEYFSRQGMKKHLITLAKNYDATRMVRHGVMLDLNYYGSDTTIDISARVSPNDNIDPFISERYQISYKEYYQQAGKVDVDSIIFSDMFQYANDKLLAMGVCRLKKSIPLSKNSWSADTLLYPSDLMSIFEVDSKEALIERLTKA